MRHSGAVASVLLCTAVLFVPEAARAASPPSAGVPTSMGAAWWSAAREDLAAAEYALSVAPELDEPQAPNRAHGFRTHFEAGSIRLVPRTSPAEAASAWEWRLRLAAWGRAGELRDLAEAPQRSVHGNRIEYRRDGLVEWYVNDSRGLEQGFTVARRPESSAGAAERPLRLEMTVGGTLAADASRDRVDFHVADGEPAIRFDHLLVTDARGTPLPAWFEHDAQRLAIVVDDRHAAYPITVDPLATSPAWTAEVDDAGALFGVSVATAGDVNGDGYSDVIVGASNFDGGQVDEGKAFVYYGSAGGLSLAPAWSIESNQAGAQLGRSVCTAGDVNGDGFSDVIVGIQRFDSTQVDEGAAHVYHGSAIGLSLSPDWVAVGGQAGALFGRSVSTAGDVNGDGFDDVIVGVLRYDNDQVDEGRAFVYHGSGGGLSLTPNWFAESNQASSEYGNSVAGAGDVNLDGFADVIVGAYFYDNGQVDEGRAFVYHGSVGGLSATPNWTAESNQANSLFGWSVASAGDVNADTYPDVIIGAYWFDNGLTNEGRAFVYHGTASGLAPSPGWTAESDQADAHFGYAVGTAGDVNGDDIDDVVVGAYGFDGGQTDEGRAYAYLGSGSGLSPTPSWTAECDQAGAAMGIAVGTAGDVNGDGLDDVLVGAYQFDNGQTDEGRAFLYLGAGPSLSVSDVSVTEGNTGTVDATFMVSLSSTRDVPVTVSYATANGSATSGNGDYVPASGVATIPARGTFTTIVVSVNGDVVDETHESFFISLSAPVNATIADGQGEGTILDDDGTGAATLTDAELGLTGLSQPAMAWGDYDADGDLDIAVVGTTPVGRLGRVYRNEGGTFTVTGALPGTAAVSTGAVAWGDYDRDGDLDLALAGDTGTGFTTQIYQNTGIGFTVLPLGLEGVMDGALAWVDFDNDGDLDLAVAGNAGTTSTTRIYRNTGGAFADAGAGLPGCRSCSMAWADYDLDGDHDLLLSGATHSFASFTTLFQNTAGVFAAVTTGLPAARDGSVDWGDADNDGDPDLLITGSFLMEIWRNTGGVFAKDAANFQRLINSAAVWGDYDNDGRLDIAAAGLTGSIGFGAVYHNDGDGFSYVSSAMPHLSSATLAWGDYDNDGDLDLMAAGNDDGTNAAIHRVYRVDGVPPNPPPAAPTGLVATVDADRVSFRWNASTGAQEGSAGLTYNLWAGRGGNADVMKPMSNPNTGHRLVPAAGNVGQSREWWLPRSAFDGGQVYWGVQAVDQAFAGSAFANGFQTLDVGGAKAVSRPTLRLAGAHPSRSESRLVFSLPHDAQVDLAIHDLMGRRIRTLIREERSTGEHEARWNGDADDGRRAAPGLYLAHLSANGESISARIVRIE